MVLLMPIRHVLITPINNKDVVKMNTPINTSVQDASVTASKLPTNPWRVVSPVLHNGKYGSVIVAEEGRHPATVSSSSPSRYLFDETVIAARSLVIVGTAMQVLEFLLTHQQRGIENRIKELPDIYMGIAPYKPKKQFSGVFPIGDTLVSVIKFFTGLVNVPSWAALPISAIDLKSVLSSIQALSDSEKIKGEVLYVKFGYMPEDGMQKIATKSITFKQVAEAIQQRSKKP
jgi:hypothetical protein